MLVYGVGVDKGKFRTCFKHLGLADLPIPNIGILDAAIPVILFLLCFPPEQRCCLKWKVLDGTDWQNRTNSSSL